MEPTQTLHAASHNGHSDLVQILINKGAGVDATRSDGRTSLQLAAIKGHSAVVRVLLAAGAKIWDDVLVLFGPGSPTDPAMLWATAIPRAAVVEMKRSIDAA